MNTNESRVQPSLTIVLQVHHIRDHSFSRYAPKGVGGSSAMRTPMHCCHSDVIICAYRAVGGSEILKFVRM